MLKLRPPDLNDPYQRPYGMPRPAAPVALDARPAKRPKVLRALRPNVGLQAAYRRRLDDLIRAMNDSVTYWLGAAFKAAPPKMAADALPANELQRAVRELAAQWERNFDEAAPSLAEWFARSSRRQTDASLRAILKNGGFSVSFRNTAASRDILQGTVHANVGLIKSIPAEYLTQVEGMVMRSVQTGRDLWQLTRDLERQYGITRRRAAFIARDQNNKATSSIQKARQLELGLDEGIWMHSGGGKHPRPKHVAADGTRFSLSKGLKVGDKGQWVMPGEEINCRCVWRAVVPGFG